MAEEARLTEGWAKKDPRVDIVVGVMHRTRFERLKRMLNVGDMRRKDGRVLMVEEARAIIAALDAHDVALFDAATETARAALSKATEGGERHD